MELLICNWFFKAHGQKITHTNARIELASAWEIVFAGHYLTDFLF